MLRTKKTLISSESTRSEIVAERELFIEILSKREAEKLIFLEESGLHMGMTCISSNII